MKTDAVGKSGAERLAEAIVKDEGEKMLMAVLESGPRILAMYFACMACQGTNASSKTITAKADAILDYIVGEDD